jgi:thiol-disulfide isomerase/thioredoxin
MNTRQYPLRLVVLFLIAVGTLVFSGCGEQGGSSGGGGRDFDVAATLKGNTVFWENGRFVQRDIPQKEYYAFYFSASWCGPCRQFTPELVRFYNNMRHQFPNFEIILMGMDRSMNESGQYMSSYRMNFPSYNAVNQFPSEIRRLAGRGIPCLVVVDKHGKVVADSYQGSNYLGPVSALNTFSAVLSRSKPSALSTVNRVVEDRAKIADTVDSVTVVSAEEMKAATRTATASAPTATTSNPAPTPATTTSPAGGTATTYTVTGAVVSTGRAMINGQILQQGDTIAGARIVAVERGQVTLEKHGERRVVEVGSSITF